MTHPCGYATRVMCSSALLWVTGNQPVHISVGLRSKANSYMLSRATILYTALVADLRDLASTEHLDTVLIDSEQSVTAEQFFFPSPFFFLSLFQKSDRGSSALSAQRAGRVASVVSFRKILQSYRLIFDLSSLRHSVCSTPPNMCPTILTLISLRPPQASAAPSLTFPGRKLKAQKEQKSSSQILMILHLLCLLFVTI
jgi:hypothetical protein